MRPYDTGKANRYEVPAERTEEVSLTSRTGNIKINEERQLTGSPGFWEDNERATAILKNIKVNEYWVKLYQAVETSMEDFAVLLEFWKAGEATEEETRTAYEKALELIEEAEFKSTLNEPEDELPAVLQINSGAGGTESQDWAEMLMRMYRMYGEKQGWTVIRTRFPGW